MPGDIFNKRARLPKRERSYCSCLLKVRQKSKQNPYGICTHTIYNQHGKTRPTVDCSINYKMENIPIEQLRSLAKERKVSVFSYNKKTKKRKYSQKRTLIRRLEDDIVTKKSSRSKKQKKKTTKRSTKRSKK